MDCFALLCLLRAAPLLSTSVMGDGNTSSGKDAEEIGSMKARPIHVRVYKYIHAVQVRIYVLQ